LVPLPDGHRPITLKWVFKLKKNEKGMMIKYKARLVARSLSSKRGSTTTMPSPLWRAWS
jgi:hypothetical protein